MAAPIPSAGTSIFDPLGKDSATPVVARGNTDISSAALGIGGVQFSHAVSICASGSHSLSTESVTATRSRIQLSRTRVDNQIAAVFSTTELSDSSVGVEKALAQYPLALQGETHRISGVECDPLQTESGADLLPNTQVDAGKTVDLAGVKGAFRFNSLLVPVEVVLWPAPYTSVTDGVSSNVVGS